MNDQQVIHALGLDDAYHVERVLASGPSGVTELVTLDGSGPFVRKRIPTGLARRGVWATLVECGCARLPRVQATYEMPDEFVVVCDFVPGENLEQLVASRGRLPQADAFRVVSQLCEAVSALHAHGIIHRDVSPANVIVAADGAHLIDLGIARFRSEGVTHDTTQLGTRGFASPEQCGYAQTDARSDVYSLGRILGYLLTGVLPETPDTAEYERVLADEDVVSPEAREIVRRASALEPSRRYQSAEDLSAALGGEKSTAAEASEAPGVPSAFAPVPRRRNWLKVLFAAMAVVAFLVAIALLLVQTFGAGEKNSDAPAVDEPAASTPAPEAKSMGNVAPTAETPELEIVESGWSVDAQGYVHYALELRNPGDVAVDYPGFTVTGRDETGAVLFSQDQVLSAIPAGGTVFWGDLAGNRGTPPAEVEFTPLEVQDYQVGMTSGGASFSVSGVRPVTDGLGGDKFVGEVTTVSDDGADFGNQVALSLVLRDGSGAIVAGAAGFASRPSVGESTSFEIMAPDMPEYATYEVYALQW